MPRSNRTPRQEWPASGENRLLAALPPDEYAQVLAQTDLRSLQARDVLYRPGGRVEYVYFPRSGVVSSLFVMLDGRSAEVGAVGREGMLGVTAFLGADSYPTQAICQVPAEVLRMPAAAFVAEVRRGGQFHDVVYRYARVFFDTTVRMAACNCLHRVEERCARWMLMCRDRIGSDEFPLTQEFLALMIGVRRASVSLAAGMLQKAGLISYRHGRITILDRDRLEGASCECYRAVRDQYERAFP
jgi:CRP-like cAMP-binding protein